MTTALEGDVPVPAGDLVGDIDSPVDLLARRVEVVRRLLDRGMPMRALEALLPGWDDAIAAASDA